MQDDIRLKTNNLLKTFKQGEEFVYAVNRVGISIPTAKITVITGPSGSGKSTLLSILAGLEHPSGGEVWLRMADTDPVLDKKLRVEMGVKHTEKCETVNLFALTPDTLTAFRGRHFGFVYQNYALIPVMTALENILLPCIYGGMSYSREWLDTLTDRLGLGARLHHLPSEMSGGEQQRVAMARALIHRPDIMFADEPTGNLDSENARRIWELLCLMRDEFRQTIILVTHDPSLAADADVCFHMQDGRICVPGE